MALSDTKLRTLAPRNRPWQLADHDGLVIEVLPTIALFAFSHGLSVRYRN
ncbi:hypothetical protein ACP26F_00200 [Franconibacter pulveris 1160]|jgi:hypothetical protein|nr:hypothetical protein [Franconibacter pulveris]